MQPSDRQPEQRAPTDDTDGYPAQDARQGYIVLRTPLRRWVFFGGLVALVVLGLALRFL